MRNEENSEQNSSTPQYTKRTYRIVPSTPHQGVEITEWTEDAWNKALEAEKAWQAHELWKVNHPLLAGLRSATANVGNFVNNEIFLNKDNIRAENAIKHPEVMDAILEGGNIAGYVAMAPAIGYMGLLAAPTALNVARIAGQAMTPSTWIGGISNAFGYTTPGWILNTADGLATYYFMNKAKDRIKEEGLNFSTGLDALMSLAPFTRDGEAINAVSNALRNPTQALRSVVDDFRMTRNAVKNSNVGSAASNLANNLRTALSSNAANVAREFNNSVKSTRLVNVPIEHVSPNGITKGSTLEVGLEGIHLSPYGSSTTPLILLFFISQGLYPHVRTGTWTYSNNTAPVEVTDVGSFRYGHNPDFDSKVASGINNYWYSNMYEGVVNGEPQISYLTMEPNNGLLLSKNIEAPINKLELQVGKISTNKPAITTNESLGQAILEGNYPIELDPMPIKLLDGTYSNTLVRRVPRELVSTEIDPHITNILNTFNSDFYRRRLADAGIVDVKQQDEIILKLVNNIRNTSFYSTSLPTKSTGAFTRFKNGKHIVVFNRTPLKPKPLPYEIHHEVGGHVAEVNIPEIQKFNESLIKDWKDNLLVDYEPNSKALDYMFRIYPDGTWEGRGMLAPAVYLMKRQGLTGELLLLSPYAKTDFHLDNFRTAMGDEWVANILNKLLILTPFIYGRNNNQRSESSEIVN